MQALNNEIAQIKEQVSSEHKKSKEVNKLEQEVKLLSQKVANEDISIEKVNKEKTQLNNQLIAQVQETNTIKQSLEKQLAEA